MVETDHTGEPLRAPGLAGVAQAQLAHGVWRAQREQQRFGWGWEAGCVCVGGEGTGFERDEQGEFRKLQLGVREFH